MLAIKRLQYIDQKHYMQTHACQWIMLVRLVNSATINTILANNVKMNNAS